MFDLVNKIGLRTGCRVLMVLCVLLPANLWAGAETDTRPGNDGDIKVLASIKPLQLIAQAITHGVVDTKVLLPAGTTPHHYALKPSDLRRVYDATLVLWLGAPYESYLAKPIVIRADNDLAVMTFDETDDERDQDRNRHSHLYEDPHVWFNPVEVRTIAQTLTSRLVSLDGDHAAQYKANLAAFIGQLQAADERIKAQFADQNKPRYIVYHDAYSHFEKHYGLQHIASVTQQPESKPGAKSLLKLRQIIAQQKVTCLFIEPQADPNIVNILGEGNNLQIDEMDPMATDIEVTANGYIQFLESTAEQILQCH